MIMFALNKKRKFCLVALLFSGIVFLIIASIFNVLVNLVIDMEMKKNLPLRKGTTAYKFWQEPPVPVSFGIYVFDITNPDEILAGTEVPSVVEKGPYVYTMHIEKTNIVYHKNNTVEYIQPQLFVFDREASVGPDTDTFKTLNFPFLTVANILQHEYAWLQEFVNDFFISQKEDTFMTRSVHDIWWGYEDPILEIAAKILHKFNKTSPLINGKFGFYMDRNNTGDGLYNVYSGLNEDFHNYVQIDRWNGQKNLSFWRADYANEIRGTDGSMHPPYITKNSKLSMFDAYLTRSLKLQYNGTSSYRGIRTLRFLVPYSEFANASVNPDNAGFCTPDVRYCIPSGAYNMSVIAYNSPVYVSLPHFVGGDPYYQRQVKGLRPSQSKHQPFYDIHALTGVSMRAARRYQIVARTQSFEHFTKFAKLPVSYLPILWIDGMAEIDKSTADMLKNELQDTLDTLPYVRAAMFGMSGLIILGTVGLLLFWRWRDKRDNVDVDDKETEPLLGRRIQGNKSNGSIRNVVSSRSDNAAAINHSGSHNDVHSDIQ